MQTTDDQTQVRCSCGAVALTAHGAPIVSLVCYCDTCQEGSRRIEALPKAPAVREPDGGTGYVSYRKDRVTFAKGRELLQDVTLEQNPKTKRVVASCCNSAVPMRGIRYPSIALASSGTRRRFRCVSARAFCRETSFSPMTCRRTGTILARWP